MSMLVVYDGDDVVGCFETYEDAAEKLGVKADTVRWYATPSARCGNRVVVRAGDGL